MGYMEGTHNYRVLDTATGKMIITRDVVFSKQVESATTQPGSATTRPNWPKTATTPIKSATTDVILHDTEEQPVPSNAVFDALQPHQRVVEVAPVDHEIRLLQEPNMRENSQQPELRLQNQDRDISVGYQLSCI